MKKLVGIALVLVVWGHGLSATEATKSDKSRKSANEIDLAIAAVNEIEALNNGMLDANSGVFHPGLKLPGQASEPGPTLSK